MVIFLLLKESGNPIVRVLFHLLDYEVEFMKRQALTSRAIIGKKNLSRGSLIIANPGEYVYNIL
jgi:hypothetical protein